MAQRGPPQVDVFVVFLLALHEIDFKIVGQEQGEGRWQHDSRNAE